MEEFQHHKRGPNFRNAGRLQELWNSLIPTRQIAAELGFYSPREVCRSVRSMRRLGLDFVYRSAGRPKKDGTQRVWWKGGAPKEPTQAQLDYWATVSELVKERHAARREAEVEPVSMADLILPPLETSGIFRCKHCQGRTDDPMGHPSCRTAA